MGDAYSEVPILLDDMDRFARPTAPSNAFDRGAHGLPGSALYVCPQTLFKLHPAYDSVFTDILREDRDARIVLIRSQNDPETEIVETRFRALAPDVCGRLVFLPRLGQEEFLALVKSADLILDPIGSAVVRRPISVAVGTPSLAVSGRFQRS